MPKLVGTRSATILLCALVAAGCSSGDSTSAESASSTSSTDATSSSPSATPSEKAASDCLFRVAKVLRVLRGVWKRDQRVERPCVYANDLGAVFMTTRNEGFGANLEMARRGCLPVVKPIDVRLGGYICVKREQSDDVVVADIVSGGRRWSLMMLLASERPHRPELSAMTALVGAAPK